MNDIDIFSPALYCRIVLAMGEVVLSFESLEIQPRRQSKKSRHEVGSLEPGKCVSFSLARKVKKDSLAIILLIDRRRHL